MLVTSVVRAQKLVSLFRKGANDPRILSNLRKALRQGNLPEKAGELLREREDPRLAVQRKELKLKRVCRCWMSPEVPSSVKPTVT